MSLTSIPFWNVFKTFSGLKTLQAKSNIYRQSLTPKFVKLIHRRIVSKDVQKMYAAEIKKRFSQNNMFKYGKTIC